MLYILHGGVFVVHVGDQVDGQFYQEMEEIVELTGTPEKAFAIFSDVVKNLFEWDENGLRKFLTLSLLVYDAET